MQKLNPNVIKIDAWNVGLNGYSLAVNPTDYIAIDIYADGYTQNSNWNETWNFGTPFAAPVVLTEIINYADLVLSPLIESGIQRLKVSNPFSRLIETQVRVFLLLQLE